MRMPRQLSPHPHTMGVNVVPIVLCCLLAHAAVAGNAPHGPAVDVTASRQRCNFTAYVMETDPAGLNVRSKPGIDGKILGRIAPDYVDASDGTETRAHPEVQVRASWRGWFLVEGAGDNTTLMGLDDQANGRAMYRGRGWVSGRKLAVKSQADRARLAPAAQAAIAFDAANLDFDGLSEQAPALIACNGQWALVEYDVRALDAAGIEVIKLKPEARVGAAPGGIRGWVDRLCDLQETACSGVPEGGE